jgi:hypothetical protein
MGGVGEPGHLNANGELFPYGIHEERSDVRAHVSVVNRTVYVFPTRNGIEAIKRENPPLRPAGQPGVEGPTAEGWLVKPDAIADMRRVRFYSWEGWKEFNKKLTTTKKGKLAVQCVIETMRRGKFPFWIDATEDQRKDIQVSGTDVLVFCKKRIQVKCDYDAGERNGPNGERTGTGHLFLQKSERNPLARH